MELNYNSLIDIFNDNKKFNFNLTFIETTQTHKSLTKDELKSLALQRLSLLNSKGIFKNSELIFQIDSVYEFVITFWACQFGGIIPVPVTIGNNDEHRLKLISIFKLLKNPYIATDIELIDKISSLNIETTLLKTIENKIVSVFEKHENFNPIISNGKNEDLAFIQFSSGSTGEPKGVMLSHTNVIQNAISYMSAISLRDSDKTLSWFPLTHDMGLLCFHIYPLLYGVNHYLIPTKQFIKNPTIWIKSADKFKATVLCSPNFGYRYLLKYIEAKNIDLSEIDLSNIEMIVNAAEPISVTLADEFMGKLKPTKLKTKAMAPAYGLAEATVAVSMIKRLTTYDRFYLDINSLNLEQKIVEVEKDSPNAITYPEVGNAMPNVEIRVVDKNRNKLDDNYIGIIEIKSTGVSKGYYLNEKASKEIFYDDGWFNSGDIGFMRDGKLIITGRYKDIIIVNGLNYYPHDIENICCELEECELNKVVAIGHRDKSGEIEDLIIFVMSRRNIDEFLDLSLKIKNLIVSKIGIEPKYVLPVKDIPRTTSGKLQRYKLLQDFKDGKFSDFLAECENSFVEENLITYHEALEILKKHSTDILGKTVSDKKALIEQGFSSSMIVALEARVSKTLNLNIGVMAFFDYPTLSEIAKYISKIENSNQKIESKNFEEIAIIGYACKFATAKDKFELWDILTNSKNCIRESNRFQNSEIKEYLKAGYLDDIDSFDNKFFDISEAESSELDPQQKLLLEVSLNALDDANINYQKEKNVGVFVGISSNEFLSDNTANYTPYTLTGSISSIASGRISYFFDFKAPSLSIDTACSSSLVSIIEAIKSLQNGECKIALAGGVNVLNSIKSFLGLTKLSALSSDGLCKTFSDDANGYVRGEGCGIVVLKPLFQALKDGDNIVATIKGFAINHDGKSNGITAPNGISQKNLLLNATSNISIDDISYIEAHGTGTKLGDPIEINALNDVFKNKKEPIFVGSIKTNIGHLESSAGVAGVIKTLLCMEHSKLVPTINISKLNSHINWNSINVKPLRELINWSGKKVAGVSSFGFSGTNAHIILESFETKKDEILEKSTDSFPLFFSAKSENSLINYIEEFKKVKFSSLKNLSFSLFSKPNHDIRFACSIKDLNDIKDLKAEPKTIQKVENIAFIFTGQGFEYKNMGLELYENYKTFKLAIDECRDILNHFDIDLINILNSDLDTNLKVQLSTFSFGYALYQLILSIGITPNLLIGHSLGEYIALCVSEVLSLKDALALVVNRAKLIDSLTQIGEMRAFLAPLNIVEDLIKEFDKLDIAVINGDENIVVSGDKLQMVEAVNLVKEQKIHSIKLNTMNAFHSNFLDEILKDFEIFANSITYKKPKIKIISNLTASLKDEFNGIYLKNHLRKTVLFSNSIKEAKNLNIDIFIEIGTSNGLTNLIKNIGENAINCLKKDKSEKDEFINFIAKAYEVGFDLNLEILYENAKKVTLPNYVFDKKRFEIKREVINSNQIELKTSNSLEDLKNIVSKLTNIQAIDIDKNIFELGISSISSIQLKDEIKKRFNIDIAIAKVYRELNTISKIAQYINQNLTPISNSPITPFEFPQTVNSNTNELFKKQIESMENLFKSQMEFLKNQTNQIESSLNLDAPYQNRLIFSSKDELLKIKNSLSETQKEFIENFIKEFNDKTKSSKEFFKISSKDMADWINSINYGKNFFILKELFYMIVANSANGAKFIDIDNNEYIDISMGYGSVFFGHTPQFLKDAISDELQKGFVLAPQTLLAHKATLLIKELTGVRRVAFSNTGTEADMIAVRIARAKTKKTKIVKFKNSYHGTFDGVLGFSDNGKTSPLALGTTYGMVADLIELEYGNFDSIEKILELKDEIAGVLVEPIQSRTPSLVPIFFVKKLREITEQNNIALIFDEVITGFRTNNGGAQKLFGIKADIVVYGKVIAGGMPIGIVAGKSEYLDYLDGGEFNFNDESYPKNEITIFGGTFVKHPLALRAVIASLEKLKEADNNLQNMVNKKTEYLATTLNKFFVSQHVPLKINYFSSFFRFDYLKEELINQPLELELFFYKLINKGVYVWERRICFLSSSHTDSDIEKIISSIKETIFELRAGGFFEEFIRDEFIKLPSTELQKRLFILSSFENAKNLYDMPFAWEIFGNLDIEQLSYAIKKVINRHDAFKTSFEIEGLEIYQKISNFIDFEVDFVELKDGSIDNFVNEFLNLQFDLSKAPLIKVTILKVENEKHILFIKAHHTIFDGLSFDIFIEEFIRAYQNLALDSNVLSYVEFSKEFENYKHSQKFIEDRAFWSGKIQTQELLNFNKSYPKVRTTNGKSLYFEIDEVKSNNLRKISKELNISENVLLLSIFSLFLSKFCDTKSFNIGIPVTLRGSKFEKCVGMFANTIVIPFDYSQSLSIKEINLNLSKLFFEILDFINYPIESLIEDLKVAKDTSTTPLFNVMYNYESSNIREFGLDNLTFKDFKLTKNSSDYDLSFDFLDTKKEIVCVVDFYCEIFSEIEIEELINHFLTLLTKIVSSNLDTNINSFDLLDEIETKTLLEIGTNSKDLNIDFMISEIFEQVVLKYPNKTALIFGDKFISYDELNQKSNQIANFLQKSQNIKSGDVVAVSMEKSDMLIATIIGVMKLNGIYLPIEPSTPTDRIEFMLKDANAKVILTDKKLINHDGLINIHDICEDNISNPIHEHNSDLVAYIIYTSGSSGTPKGVEVTNKSFINMMISQRDVTNISLDDVALQFASISFDTSIMEIFTILTTGATLVVASKDDLLEHQNFYNILDKYKITVVDIAPSFLATLDEDKLSNLKKIISGGESPNRDKAISLAKKLDFFNIYGPTECSVSATYHKVSNNQNYKTIPIGKPNYNTSLYILDSDLNLLPFGSVGELYIGGDGVAKGYLNNQTLTNQKFINHHKFGRVYRSGDKAKWNEFCELEFFGRVDFQVKVRGFRVELEEIENIIEQHKQIIKAVVLLRDANLVAYYKSSDNLNIETELFEFLKSKLPNYMVPTYFIKVDEFPLTINKKIDKNALLNIQPEKKEILETSLNSYEKILLDSLKDVLKNETISIFDNYFLIGGDSIKAILLSNNLSKNHNLELQIKDIFAYPNLKEMAKKLKIKSYTISKAPIMDYYPISSSQKRLFVIEELNGGRTVYHMNGALKIEALLDEEIFKKALFEVLNRHEIFKTRFDFRNGEIVQIIENSIKFDEIFKVMKSSENLKEYLDFEAQNPFNLLQTPLIRVILIQNSNESILFVNMHHIISDGRSVTIFLEELEECYLSQDKEPNLKPLEFQYKDYAYFESQNLKNLTKEKNYWLEKLSNIEELNLKTDFPRDEIRKYLGAKVDFEIDFELSERIIKFAKDSEITTSIFFQTVIKLFLYLKTYQRNIVLGVPNEGRQNEFLNQIGFYLQMLPILDTIEEHETIKEFLNRVKNSTIESFENSFYPFDKIVEDLNIKTDRSRHPIFDVMFIFHNNTKAINSFANFKASEYLNENQFARFDLDFEIVDSMPFCGFIEYDVRLFKKESIEKFIKELTLILEFIIENPQKTILDLKEIVKDKSEIEQTNSFLEQINSLDEDF